MPKNEQIIEAIIDIAGGKPEDYPVIETEPDYEPDHISLPVHKLVELLAAARPMTPPEPTERRPMEAGAEAMWDALPMVRYGIRPQWAQLVHDPEWDRSVRVTRQDSSTVLNAAALAETFENVEDLAIIPEGTIGVDGAGLAVQYMEGRWLSVGQTAPTALLAPLRILTRKPMAHCWGNIE